MKPVGGTLALIGLTAGAAAVAWNLLLDERAKSSLKITAESTGNLLSHFVKLYMGAEENEADEGAAQRNREWIEWQWKQAGY